MSDVADAEVRPRVLMLAPHPVLQTRGSPIHVWQRLKALSELGYAVDLVTYPLGEPLDLPHVRVVRVWRPWGLRRIAIGLSPAKIFLDVLLAAAALRALWRTTYVAVHSHEEAAFFGFALARVFGVPHLYDMHSSLPEQLSAWRPPARSIVIQLARRLERAAVRGSALVVAVAPGILERARACGPTQPPLLVENTAVAGRPASAEEIEVVRRRHGLEGGPVVVYVGNFEPYQGIDLLLQSFARVRSALPAARLLVAGGETNAVDRLRAAARSANLDSGVILAGMVPFEQLPGYLAVGDVLVSTRVAGAAPMKIYTYLQAGRPIVATDVAAHREALPAEVALLADPEPAAFADALIRVLTHAAEAARLSANARAFAAAKIGDTRYRDKIAEAYRLMTRADPSAATTDTRQTGAVALPSKAAAIRAYWNRFLHDQQMSSAPPGSPRWFDELAEYRYSKQPYLEHLPGFSAFAGRDLLEVGCGIGLDLARFARGGARVVGVDVAERAIALAREHLRQQQAVGEVLVMSGDALGFASGSFDVAYAHGVLPYVERPQAIVDEVHRVLRDGGTAVFMAYHSRSWLWWMSRLTRVGLEHAGAPVFRAFSQAEMRSLLRRFRRIEISIERFPVATRLHHGGRAELYNRVFVPAFNAIPRGWIRPFGWHLMVTAEK